jgi:hypothetical protein
MSPKVSFQTDWKPELNGNRLGGCPPIQSLIDDDERPSGRNPHDAKWVPSSYKGWLGGVPEARSAIVETVLAIWRLRAVEGSGPEDPTWKDHLEAWLVCAVLGLCP